MKIFVWKGEHVLKNYGSGMVVISAIDEDAAWERLKAEDFRIWFWLQTGVSYVDSEEASNYIDRDDYSPNHPQHPVAYDLDNLPVLFVVGGE